MTFTVKDILESAAIILQDGDAVRWTRPELLIWINSAVREIANRRPEAVSFTIEKNLQPGTFQKLDRNLYSQIFDALRNINAPASSPSGRTGARSITTITRAEIDAIYPAWSNPAIMPYNDLVAHVIYDENDPVVFYVVPGNTGQGLIEMTVAKVPVPIPLPAANPLDLASYAALEVDLPDNYQNAVLDYTVYRALSKEVNLPGSTARAAAHLSLFNEALGVRSTAEIGNNINTPKHRHER